MLRPSTPSEFLANPIGRYCAGQRHCVFAHSPTLLGFASWGRPDAEDVSQLLRLCAIGLEPGMTPYRWLVNVRNLELVVPATFGLFLEYTSANGATLGRNIARQAQLSPEGLVGAIISGFSHVARLPYPDRVFRDVEEALGWLDVERTEGIELLSQLEAIRRGACESYAVVTRLITALDSGAALSIDAVAQRLGLSPRSLQRALREAGTTFRMELKAHRLRRAEELLRGDRTLRWIAAEVGFSSAQNFATAYRRAMGETPSERRMRNRRAG